MNAYEYAVSQLAWHRKPNFQDALEYTTDDVLAAFLNPAEIASCFNDLNHEELTTIHKAIKAKDRCEVGKLITEYLARYCARVMVDHAE